MMFDSLRGMKKVLVISAHPDDEVLGMGELLAKLTATGCEVTTSHCYRW